MEVDTMSDDEYDYEYDYSDDDDDDDGNEESGSCCDDQDHAATGDAANPNAPPATNQNHSSSNHTNNTNTWVAKRPAAVCMMPAEDLVPEMNRRLKDVTEALGVPLAAAAPLLREHQWSVQSLLQSYYSNPTGVLEQAGVLHRCREQESINDPSSSHVAGILSPTTTRSTAATECSICMDVLEEGDNTKLAMKCGHEFCLDCWQDYLTNVVQEDGATCVLATCPQSTCTEVLTEEEVTAAAPHLLSQFQHFQLRSFVDSNELARWCPGKGCERVAHCVKQTKAFVDEQDKIADCDACHLSFCIACGEEPHIPVACKILAQWHEKNNNESETANWITANTKTCPKCATRIQKDGGCMYVTCRKCRHGFCWVCMGTHHVWNCNAYKEGDADADQTRAKNELERYLHYYQRYHGHAQAQKFARKQLKKMDKREDATGSIKPNKKPATPKGDKDSSSPKEDKKTTTITRDDGGGGGECDLRFLKDANQQLIKCRRVLKYTYVFAYYKFTNPSLKRQKECFEHHQGILEGLTEGLSKVTEETEIAKIDQQDVINRTRVLEQFIKNVLEHVDNGMVE